MELEQAKKRVEELRAVIEKNNRLYYDQDAPELEDFEYDALTRELKELEAQFPQLITATSPTQKVGGTASSKLPKVTHAVKMESLLDAFSFDELRDFDRRVREAGVCRGDQDRWSFLQLGVRKRTACPCLHPR